MKIYILPVSAEFQPPTIPVTYPAHNANFKDAEEIFLDYLRNQLGNCIVSSPTSADWHYLPIYWTHWMVTNKFGKVNLDKLQNEVSRCLLDDSKTFTIHEYAEQPKVNVGQTLTFLGSRTSKGGVDIPLLCKRHREPTSREKKYLASFVGSMTTHPIREQIKQKLGTRSDVCIAGGGGTDYFVDMMGSSYIGLCPRGYGGASYRFYEAMDIGVVPYLIGDIDHRPFKKYISWDDFSLYSRDIGDLDYQLSKFSEEHLLFMGSKAKQVYETCFVNGQWCKYVISMLEEM
jgi:hypothetical protein